MTQIRIKIQEMLSMEVDKIDENSKYLLIPKIFVLGNGELDECDIVFPLLLIVIV